MNLLKTSRKQMMSVLLPIMWRLQKIMLCWKHPRNPQNNYFLKFQILCSIVLVNSKTQVYFYQQQQKKIMRVSKRQPSCQKWYTIHGNWRRSKNIIHSIDHILNHDLVCKHPAAANFVGMVERNMQETKEEFNKVVLLIFGTNIGRDN